MNAFHREHEGYLDTVAMKAMEAALLKRTPANLQDQIKIASVAYTMALVMLKKKLDLGVTAKANGILFNEMTKNDPSE